MSRGRTWIIRLFHLNDLEGIPSPGTLPLNFLPRILLGPRGDWLFKVHWNCQGPLSNRQLWCLTREPMLCVGHLSGSPFRTWYLHSQGKDLDAEAEGTKYRLVHEIDVTPYTIVSSRCEFLLTLLLGSPRWWLRGAHRYFPPETASKLKRTVTTKSIPHSLIGCLCSWDTGITWLDLFCLNTNVWVGQMQMSQCL